jgi:hypothetical protein
VALIAGSATLPSADVALRTRLQTLGLTVSAVDDDRIATAGLTNYDAIVISSSVVPSKITSTLADLAVPIISLETYAHNSLRLGTNASETTGQSTLTITDPTHPIAIGLNANQTIATATTLGRANPVAGATKIASPLNKPDDATIFAIDTETALTTGTAPARRVGYYLGYPAPPLLKTPGWQLFDAALNWALTTAPPPVSEPWHIDALSNRAILRLDPGTSTRTDHPLDVAFDAGGAVPFDPDTIRVVEVDDLGALVDDAVPVQFDRAVGFDPISEPRGTLILLLEGATAGARRFHVYFDGPDAPPAPAQPALVSVTQGVVDEGQQSLRIDASSSSWFYHLQGGGFSSIVDSDGNDWLNYNQTFGSAGTYRGIPNAVYPAGHFHPGATTSTTALLSSGPLRVSLESTTNDGLWKARWDVYPTFAKMTMQRAAGAYWFLYEGTPGGQIDPTSDKVIRATGASTDLGTAWSGDIPGEWAAFADTVIGRSLFVAQYADDTLIDSHYLMENNMTVFGFGRQNTNRYLTGSAQFVVGLRDATSHAALAGSIDSIRNPISVSIARIETRLS